MEQTKDSTAMETSSNRKRKGTDTASPSKKTKGNSGKSAKPNHSQDVKGKSSGKKSTKKSPVPAKVNNGPPRTITLGNYTTTVNGIELEPLVKKEKKNNRLRVKAYRADLLGNTAILFEVKLYSKSGVRVGKDNNGDKGKEKKGEPLYISFPEKENPEFAVLCDAVDTRLNSEKKAKQQFLWKDDPETGLKQSAKKTLMRLSKEEEYKHYGRRFSLSVNPRGLKDTNFGTGLYLVDSPQPVNLAPAPLNNKNNDENVEQLQAPQENKEKKKREFPRGKAGWYHTKWALAHLDNNNDVYSPICYLNELLYEPDPDENTRGPFEGFDWKSAENKEENEEEEEGEKTNGEGDGDKEEDGTGENPTPGETDSPNKSEGENDKPEPSSPGEEESTRVTDALDSLDQRKSNDAIAV